MASGAELREGIEILVRCRVGKVYDPPNPALLMLIVGGQPLMRPTANVLVYADDLDWQPAPAANPKP
jgi:hypothetical protein